MSGKKLHISIVALAMAMLAMGPLSCSTTSRIAKGQTLYTGVKKLEYHALDSVKCGDGVKDQIFEAINVKPNNPLYSPYYRTPFPIGLWVYNHWDQHATGLKGWLYRKLVAQPVLISTVKPQTRVEMINTLLQNNGYFDSSASYKLNYSSESKRKASITYVVDVHKPYVIGHVEYLGDKSQLGVLIDSLAQANAYFKSGNRYCLDSLNNVRISITNALRDKGYYYFRPEYIRYYADSVASKGSIDMQLTLASDIPNSAIMRYMTNDVTATIRSDHSGNVADTVQTRNCTIYKYEPAKVKPELISSCIRSRKGAPFRVGNMDRTQMYLSRTGIFSLIDMQVQKVDSVTPSGDGLLDVNVFAQLDKPLETKFEIRGTSKSNSFIGPGLDFSVTNKNLLGGGEQLSATLRAAYEWQTGKGSSGNNSDLNSYDFGADVSFSIPRLLAPRFVDRSRRYLNWTRFSIYGDILNRPSYFKIAQAGGKMSWEWHANKKSLNEFTPFKLTYSKLIHRTAAFDSAMAANRAIALSFEDAFIPSMQYSYTYDSPLGSSNNITWSFSVMEAGNIFAGVWSACGSKGTKKLFGTPFSQFVKAQTQAVFTHELGGDQRIVARVMLGAAHAYGNSSQVPYSEQFYIGGANSVRAFTVRTIGPGSYHADQRSANAYYDQTGTFKFECNAEYRFPLLGYLKGALFVDAGNVWLLKNDEMRPGGKLRMNKFFDQLALGTGLGLRFDMQMLVIRADLGIGIHAPYDTGNSGYYNIKSFRDAWAFHLAIGYPF